MCTQLDEENPHKAEPCHWVYTTKSRLGTLQVNPNCVTIVFIFACAKIT